MNRRTLLAAAATLPLLAACMPGTMPAGSDTILSRAEADPDLSTFVAAVKAAGMEGRLASAGPFTVFAPTNHAFARLGQGRVDALMKPGNRAALRKLLSHHVGRGGFTAQMLSGQKLQIATIGGGSLVADGTHGLRVDRAPVTGKAVQAANGTLFKITRVLER